MIENQPAALRKVYFDAWQKAQQNFPLAPMEAIIVDIIQRHPEYHPIFAAAENFADYSQEKYALDHNPFFHLALHVTIAEQIGSDRPAGIRLLYQQLLKKYGDVTTTEHQLMECLAKILVESFANQSNSSEELYLEAIKQLL